MNKPRTKAGRRLLRWIDANATDDRMIYAVVKNGPTVGDLREAIRAVEVEAAAIDPLRLARAVEGVWDPAADADEALETVDLGQGHVQLRPHERLLERIASEYDRLLKGRSS